jgi:hypothetical protein
LLTGELKGHAVNHTTDSIRSKEDLLTYTWPGTTRAVTHLDDAYVVHACGDFDIDDLNLVRSQFPHRRVTLDGDVITVWPRPGETR